MTSKEMPTWIRYSERAFGLNFIAFSFVMFSCLFPTGFASTFSTFAFIFALPVLFYRIQSVELNLYEAVGIALFGWLLISVGWSDEPILKSLDYLFEYRIYFMVPVLASVLALNEQTQRWAFVAAMLGAFFAMVASYGLGFGWWKFDGAQFSLANRIYHGFIMSIFLLACLLIAREANGVLRLLSAAVALLAVYNVMNIEIGRTGYLQVMFVYVTFVMLTFKRMQSVFAISCAVIIFSMFYVSSDRFHERVNQTLANVEKAIVLDDYHSSAGYRLEFYRAAISVGLDHPVTGVGVGSVTKTLQSRVESGQMRVLTDNVHGEFMNMLIAGGVPALFLFTSFVISIVYSGIAVGGHSRWLRDAFIGLGVIVFVSACFNSTIKDYGEKHALIIMLSILGARLSLLQNSSNHEIGKSKYMSRTR